MEDDGIGFEGVEVAIEAFFECAPGGVAGAAHVFRPEIQLRVAGGEKGLEQGVVVAAVGDAVSEEGYGVVFLEKFFELGGARFEGEGLDCEEEGEEEFHLKKWLVPSEKWKTGALPLGGVWGRDSLPEGSAPRRKGRPKIAPTFAISQE